jgi:hypothetical protein
MDFLGDPTCPSALCRLLTEGIGCQLWLFKAISSRSDPGVEIMMLHNNSYQELLSSEISSRFIQADNCVLIRYRTIRDCLYRGASWPMLMRSSSHQLDFVEEISSRSLGVSSNLMND